MPLFQGVLETDLTIWMGSILALDAYSVPPDHGLYAQNVTYVREQQSTTTTAPNGNQVATRYGHSTVITITTDGPITALYNFFFIFGAVALGTFPISTACYYAPLVGVRTWEQGPTPGFGPIIGTVTGAAWASFSGDGQRLYMAYTDPTGRAGFAGGQIYGWDIGTDPLFASPVNNSMTFSQPSTGSITAGLHNFGFLTTTRNGYTGLLQPAMDVTGTPTFQPVSFTASGGNNLQVTISGSVPSYSINGTTQIVMTTVANPNQYFAVPGAIDYTTNPTIIVIDIDDNTLAETATDVTSYMDVLTSTVAGAAPFYPSAVFSYSSRGGYVAVDGAGFPVIYISDPSNYQFITADQHGIYLENQAQPVHCFSLRGVCYIGTQYSFYSIEDNGDVPVTWTPPQLVDGQIGILSPTCVWVNASAGYAAIASDRGFYIFQGGVFPALPLSYYQASDWARINWMLPTTVQVVDDQLHKRFIVQAPLTSVVTAVSGSLSGGPPYTVTATNNNPQNDAGNPLLYQSGLSVKTTSVSTAQTITVTGLNTFAVPSYPPTVGDIVYPQTASHQMTWDYTEGDTPDTVKYSLNTFAAYNAGALTIMKNLSNSLQEVWYACAQNGPIIRQNDGSEANPWRDVTTAGGSSAIDSWYETALVPGPADQTATIHFYHGAHFRVRGSGDLNLEAYGLDGNPTVVPAASPITLSNTPGLEVLVKWFLFSEQQSIGFGTNALDQWFQMNVLKAYYTDEYSQR